MSIKLTEAAALEAKKYLESTEETYLRVGVKGGGCSGFSYSLQGTNEYNEEQDNLINKQGVNILVDKKSALYLDGTIIDYYNDIAKQGFTFENPNAVKTCGCGSSFQA
tara:strand:+ start:488 stop:811 length:324 start_codon:yes stop_codon:yes gene_type:complete